jgi:hypothetical protein
MASNNKPNQKKLDKQEETMSQKNSHTQKRSQQVDTKIAKPLTEMEVEFLKKSLDLQEDQHNFEMKVKMDRLLVTFSRLLVAAAILTLLMLLLSSFEIPYVSIEPEFVKMLITAVIVEISGIVSVNFIKNRDQEKSSN